MCENHTQHEQLEEFQSNYNVVQLLRTSECLRHILNVFSTNDHVAHGLAIRVMWCLFRGIYRRKNASDQFTQYLSIYCSGAKFNIDTKNALLALLLSNPEEVPSKLAEREIVFFIPVKQWFVWRALLGCLKDSDFSIRKQALQDVNTILHDNFDNCKLLCRDNKWQRHIFPVFTDILKTQKAEDPVKSCFAYAINALTLVHFQFFMKDAGLEQVLANTLYMLHQFGGSTNEGQEVASTILGALVSKLTSQYRLFSGSDRDTFEWQNLKAFNQLLKKFVFVTAYWQSLMPVGMDEEDEMALQEMGELNRSPYVLSKNRLGKNEQSVFDEPTITDYGLHWSDGEKGEAVDIRLIKKVQALLKKLALTDVDLEQFGDVDREQREFYVYWERQYKFWEDSLKLAQKISRSDIERGALSYRRFSHIVQAYLGGGSRDRRSGLRELSNLLEGREGLE